MMTEIFGIPLETIAAGYWFALGCVLHAVLFVLVLFISVVAIGGCLYGLYCAAKMARDFVRDETEGWDW